MLYNLNLRNVISQLHLNKTGGKKLDQEYDIAGKVPDTIRRFRFKLQMPFKICDLAHVI